VSEFSSSSNPVGYIDNALPMNQIRLRFDAGYNFHRPNRAEFFYAKTSPAGPGLPVPEPRIDYQDLSCYLEVAPRDSLSAFVEIPWRFLNPEVNANVNGLADMNAGFKFGLVQGPDVAATFQLRTYAPTGDASRGLGTHHVSLEPALLVYKPLTERLGCSGELRYWVPIGGTDFAGDIVRYGAGVFYDVYLGGHLTLTPVAEFVGWTVLNGKESAVGPSGQIIRQDAEGNTIVNVKLGLRATFGNWGDIYGGYGRPLTGDRWYANIFRLEFRLYF
jgi:hypothetical protein